MGVKSIQYCLGALDSVDKQLVYGTNTKSGVGKNGKVKGVWCQEILQTCIRKAHKKPNYPENPTKQVL